MATAGAAPPGRRNAKARPAVAATLRFRAFADPTRLRILHLLRDREICVGDLVRALRVPQARASRHLNYLRRAGLVRARKDGLWVHYSLAPAADRLHRSLLECLASSREDVPQIGTDESRYAAVCKSGGCCP